MTDQDIVLEVAYTYLGTPYIWGGDDPSGFDCSGFVIECLQSVGAFPRGSDTTADGLMRRFTRISGGTLEPTDLVFWTRPSGRAIHVGMVIDPPHLYIGAEGGGSSTDTAEAAWRRNAYIKIRPIQSRGSQATRRYARWR